MMKFLSIAVCAAALLAAPLANAGEWGQRGDTNVRVKSVSNSYSQSSSSSTSSGNRTSFQDRVQAPGFGVGGGYCSNALSISGPGFGIGFSAMERMCKIEIGARVAKTYLNAGNAAAYVCNQSEFAQLPACRAAKRR